MALRYFCRSRKQSRNNVLSDWQEKYSCSPPLLWVFHTNVVSDWLHSSLLTNAWVMTSLSLQTGAFQALLFLFPLRGCCWLCQFLVDASSLEISGDFGHPSLSLAQCYQSSNAAVSAPTLFLPGNSPSACSSATLPDFQTAPSSSSSGVSPEMRIGGLGKWDSEGLFAVVSWPFLTHLDYYHLCFQFSIVASARTFQYPFNCIFSMIVPIWEVKLALWILLRISVHFTIFL